MFLHRRAPGIFEVERLSLGKFSISGEPRRALRDRRLSPASAAARRSATSFPSTSCARASSGAHAGEMRSLGAAALRVAGAGVRAIEEHLRRLHVVDHARAQLPDRFARHARRAGHGRHRRHPPQLPDLGRGLLLGSDLSRGAALDFDQRSPGRLFPERREPQPGAVPHPRLPHRRPGERRLSHPGRLQQSLRLLGPGRSGDRLHHHHLGPRGRARSSTPTSS